jgi:ABC-type siderophore export system fused ATPase/permease subunit
MTIFLRVAATVILVLVSLRLASVAAELMTMAEDMAVLAGVAILLGIVAAWVFTVRVFTRRQKDAEDNLYRRWGAVRPHRVDPKLYSRGRWTCGDQGQLRW